LETFGVCFEPKKNYNFVKNNSMTTFKVNKKNKEGKALLGYLKSLAPLSIVKIIHTDDSDFSTMDDIVKESRVVRKKIAKKYI
jgi:hypothetical protein